MGITLKWVNSRSRPILWADLKDDFFFDNSDIGKRWVV